MNTPQPLLLELGMEQCVYCGKTAEDCEHSIEELQGSGEYETEAERNQ